MAKPVEVPCDPQGLSNFYLKASTQLHLMDSLKELNDPVWMAKYRGSVSSTPLTAGLEKRSIFLENRQHNSRFSSDWELWHKGCDPQQFKEGVIGRTGTREKFSHMLHMAKKTDWYHLETILTKSLNLPRQLAKDMEYLERTRRNIYDEYFRSLHFANSDRHWIGVYNAANQAQQYVAHRTPGSFPAGSNGMPWRWGTDADGCISATDRIYLDPSITDINWVMPMTDVWLRKLQLEHAADVRRYDVSPVRVITDTVSADQIGQTYAESYQNFLIQQMGPDLNRLKNKSLSVDNSITNFVDYEIDPLPWRGYHDPALTSGAGELCIVRIDPFIDVSEDTLTGVRSEQNPDYDDPTKAAFQIDVPWTGETYTPYRASIPDQVGKVRNHPQTYAQWQWINNKDMELNKLGNKGFFFMQDNMLAEPNSRSYIAGLGLHRRRTEDLTNLLETAALSLPTLRPQADDTTCDDVQWKNDDPNAGCNGTTPKVGGSCTNCI